MRQPGLGDTNWKMALEEVEALILTEAALLKTRDVESAVDSKACVARCHGRETNQ